MKMPQVATEGDNESKHIAVLPPSTDNEKKTTLPKVNIKVDANIQDFRVAIIESVDSSEPQALMLKVHCKMCCWIFIIMPGVAVLENTICC